MLNEEVRNIKQEHKWNGSHLPASFFNADGTLWTLLYRIAHTVKTRSNSKIWLTEKNEECVNNHSKN